MTHDIATPEGRAELRKLCEAATSGPWKDIQDGYGLGRHPYISVDSPSGAIIDVMTRARLPFTRQEVDVPHEANAAFIAAAREALPAALDRLDALEAALRIAAKAELYDPGTGIIDADVLEIVQSEARKALGIKP